VTDVAIEYVATQEIESAAGKLQAIREEDKTPVFNIYIKDPCEHSFIHSSPAGVQVICHARPQQPSAWVPVSNKQTVSVGRYSRQPLVNTLAFVAQIFDCASARSGPTASL
jgi:hypothetical protein